MWRPRAYAEVHIVALETDDVMTFEFVSRLGGPDSFKPDEQWERERRLTEAISLASGHGLDMEHIRIWIWMIRWRLRTHARNHDTKFCGHRSKIWKWRMEDGCQGQVCEWCHLLEAWCPTSLPDVQELVRVPTPRSA